jgi:putative membrane protein
VIAHLGHGDAWGGLWGLVGLLAALAFVALVVLAVAAMLRAGGRVEHAGRSTAVRVLEERYARGEISREEFVERRDVLRGGRRTPPPADEPPNRSP